MRICRLSFLYRFTIMQGSVTLQTTALVLGVSKCTCQYMSQRTQVEPKCLRSNYVCMLCTIHIYCVIVFYAVYVGCILCIMRILYVSTFVWYSLYSIYIYVYTCNVYFMYLYCFTKHLKNTYALLSVFLYGYDLAC